MILVNCWHLDYDGAPRSIKVACQTIPLIRHRLGSLPIEHSSLNSVLSRPARVFLS